MPLALDWDGTCTVSDSLVEAVRIFGDPAIFRRAVRLLRRVARRRGRDDPGHGAGGRGVGGRRGAPQPGAARARRAARRRDRLERAAAADPAGARPRGARGRGALQRRRAAARRLAAAASGTTGRAPSAGTCASGARFPRAARSSTSATASPTAAPRAPPTASSRAAGSRTTSARRGFRTSASRLSTTLLLRFPEPYDFEVSTERFRVFGPDLANLWVDGALHRVIGGREVRIAAAPGGVDVEPLDGETRAGGREAARPRVRARAVHGLGGRAARALRDRRRARRASARRSRPTRSRASSPRSPRSRCR